MQNAAYNDTLRQKDEEIKKHKVEIEALYLKIDSDINRSRASQSEPVIHRKEGMEKFEYDHAIDTAKKAFQKYDEQDDIASYISD